MGKRKRLAFLTVAAGAVTAVVLRRRHRQSPETPGEAPQETPPSAVPEEESAAQIP